MADAIKASSEDGVLRIMVPKAEQAKPKRIEVHSTRTHTPEVPRSTTS